METVFVIAALKLVGYGLATIGQGLGQSGTDDEVREQTATHLGLAGGAHAAAVAGDADAEALALIGFVLAFIL